MNAVIERALHLGLEGSSPCIVVSNIEVIEAISQAVDVTQMTDAELLEAIVLINKAVMGVNLDAVVQEALSGLSFGGSQARLAKAGGYPCESCPDCYLDTNGSCENEHHCTAWSIYSSQY